MKMYVGVTDYDWFTYLKEQQCDEVNFWTPGGNKNFKALTEATAAKAAAFYNGRRPSKPANFTQE